MHLKFVLNEIATFRIRKGSQPTLFSPIFRRLLGKPELLECKWDIVCTRENSLGAYCYSFFFLTKKRGKTDINLQILSQEQYGAKLIESILYHGSWDKF